MSGGTDVVSAFVGGCPLLPVHAGELQARVARRARRGVRRGRAVGRRRDRRAGPDRAAAVDAALLLERPRRCALPRELLRDVPGRLAPRRLDPDHGAGQRGHRGPLGFDAQPAGHPVRHERAVRRRRGSAGDRRQPRHRARAAGRAATGCRSSSSSPTVSSWTRPSRGRIKAAIREQLSQRHVPDEIVAVPAIPRTLTGKKMEVPVKRLFLGRPLAGGGSGGGDRGPGRARVVRRVRRGRGRSGP